MLKKIRLLILPSLLLTPIPLHASFIESTMGTAVVNDATATYHNPAALTLVKNPQLIGLGSVSDYRSTFTGNAVQSATGFTQSGSTNLNVRYYLPSFYFAAPSHTRVTTGLAIISNLFNNDPETSSLLRYAQPSNSIQNIDFIPAMGFKINDYLALGAGLNFSYASFDMNPIFGFPSLNIPDSQSRNESNGSGLGGNFGFLLRPAQATLIGFDYRSAVSYTFNGKSSLSGSPGIESNDYHFNFWTPARSVLSISQFVKPTLGFIGTVQRVQWSILKNVNLHNVATQVGTHSVILPNATIQYYSHNTWIFTLGTIYRATPKWIVRAAATYNQTPGNPNYQISNGDSIILGASMGYEINKNFIVDGSYAHAFFKNENIHTSGINKITGVNKSALDAVSIKLTFNF